MHEFRFPDKLPGALGGLDFEEVFLKCPKEVQFAYTCWTYKGTDGIFLEFLKYVHNKMLIPAEKFAHENRCREYVKHLPAAEIPSYLSNYTE